MKSKILVFSQFFIIFLMTLPFGTPTNSLYIGLIISLFGVFVGVMALVKNEIGNFNIRPDIKDSGVLITNGIYGYIRHPMYASVLVIMFGVIILYPSEFEYILYTLLVITLLIKLFYEESLWKFENKRYQEYMQTTKRLIPFVF